MKLGFLLLTLLTTSLAIAGNGVERGTVDVIGLDGQKKEIINFIKRNLTKCAAQTSDKVFEVLETKKETHDVMFGVETSYELTVRQLGQDGESINHLVVNVYDADLDQWKVYEEKLSFAVVEDQNNFCLSK